MLSRWKTPARTNWPPNGPDLKPRGTACTPCCTVAAVLAFGLAVGACLSPKELLR